MNSRLDFRFDAFSLREPVSTSLENALPLHSAGAGDAASGPQRAARLQRRQIADELTRTVFPGTRQREIPAGVARHAERADAGATQIIIQRADPMIGNHIERTGD